MGLRLQASEVDVTDSASLKKADFSSEDDCLLGCCAAWSGRSLPTFQRCLLPPSSGLIALMMEVVSTSETLVDFYQTTRCNITETAIFITRLLKNLNSHRLQQC
jgi:hypothetical protein